MGRWLLELPHVLARRGLDVFVVDGWGTRGAGGLPMADRPVGPMAHWIVSTLRGSKSANQTLGVIVHGHSTLPGPLANLYLRWDGAVGVVAAGRANHGGVGSWRGVSGNQYFIGIEAEGPPFTPEQLAAYPRVLAACCDITGRHPREWAIGHHEYAPRRKVDVEPYMAQIRAEAIRIYDGAPPAPITPVLEDDMPFIISAPGRGQGLIGGHGYSHIPTPEFVQVISAKTPGIKTVSCNDREFDILAASYSSRDPKALSGIQAAVATLLDRPAAEVDAAAVAAAIPASIAGDVADELAQRLQS